MDAAASLRNGPQRDLAARAPGASLREPRGLGGFMSANSSFVVLVIMITTIICLLIVIIIIVTTILLLFPLVLLGLGWKFCRQGIEAVMVQNFKAAF